MSEQDKPGTAAIEAAHQVAGELDTAYLERQHRAVAAIIQAAIDSETAAVEAKFYTEESAHALTKNNARIYQIERDEVRAAARELGKAVDLCERAINDNSRSAGISVIGFNALRAQLASAGRAASEALTKHAALLAEPEGGG